MGNLVITNLSWDDVKAEIDQCVRNAVVNARASHSTIPDEILLSRKDAAKLLGISLTTIGEWTKAGLITGYRIGSFVRYKKNELEDSCKEIKSAKQRR